jgi:hypothetical protein
VVWFKVDDDFHDHPKTWDLPDCAVALWTRAGSWSGRNLTDGVIPPEMVSRWCEDPERAVEALTKRGLWSAESVDGGVDGLHAIYRYHDWPDYQPTREEVARSRASHTRSQRKWRHKKAGDQDEGREPVDGLHGHLQSDVDAHVDDAVIASREMEQRSPPDPTRPGGSGVGVVAELTESRPAPRRQPAPSGAPVASGKQPPPVNQLCRRCGGNHPTEECPTGRHEPVSEDRRGEIAKSGAEEVRAAIRDTMNGRALGAAPEPGHWRDPRATAAAQVAEARQLRGELPAPESERGDPPDEMPF